jgi:hypothetical protein
MSTKEYIVNRGQPVFETYEKTIDIIKSLNKRDIAHYNYIYEAKLDNITKKWYIEWILKNPNYKDIKQKSFEIEI